jgi:hypothetical protein
VGLWLARPSLQRCLRNGSWLRVVGDYDIFITVRKLENVRNRLQYFWQVGTFAKDALGRGASQCQTLRWIIDILYERQPPFRIDPWRQFDEANPLAALPDGFDLEESETVLIGAAVHGAFETFAGRSDPAKILNENDGEIVQEVMRKTMQLGVETLANHAEICKRSSDSFLKSLR